MRRTRRSVLRTAGLAGVAGFAGCFGTGDEGEGTGTTSGATTRSGPAEFEAEVSAPADPTVDGAIPLTVAVTNTGGEAGTFRAPLRVSGPQQRSSEVSLDVAPGETARTTAEITVAYAGTYRARLGETASTEFTVQPREADLGAAVALDEAFEVSVERASVEWGLLVEDEGPFYFRPPVPGVLPAEDRAETMLLVLEASVRNTGDENRVFDPSALPLTAERGEDPAFYTDLGAEITPGVTVSGASATLGMDPLAGLEVPPSSTREGWLLAPLSRETARGALQIEIQRDDGGAPEVQWSFAPGAEQRQLPEFEVESLSVPDEQTNTTTGEFTATVRNTGEATGTYRGVLKISAIESYDPVGSVSGEVAPGETAELTGEFRMPFFGGQGMRLVPSGLDRAEITGTALEVPFGETVTTPSGTTVRLSEPLFEQGFSYTEDPTHAWDNSVLLTVSALHVSVGG